MTSDNDLVRFHNGDTLDNIPVIRDIPSRPIPWRTVGGMLGAAIFLGGVFGASFGMGDRSHHDTADASPPTVSVTPSSNAPAPAPAVTVTTESTETVTAVPSVEPHQPYAETVLEQVYVVETPVTGGDPSTDYCFTFDDSYGTVLLADALPYECQDFLFSTHPKDMTGVFESAPVDCSATPGARSAELTFAASTDWGEGQAFTCLLHNDRA